MEIVAAIVGAILAVLAGAWINNVFIWKIKNRVNALDVAHSDVSEYNDAFLSFCWKHKESNGNTTEINTIREEFNRRSGPIIKRGYHNYFIIDEVKCGKIYKKVLLLSQEITTHVNPTRFDSLTQRWTKPSPESFVIINDAEHDEIAKYYNKLLNDTLDAILEYRKEITSFCYMMKQICHIKCYKAHKL